MSQPTVSKQVALLEALLGAQLLHRTSRGVSLTEAGQTYYEAAVKVLTDLDAAESMVGRGQSRLSALLRVSVSAGFGRLMIVPLVPSFIKNCPEIALYMMVSDRFVPASLNVIVRPHNAQSRCRSCSDVGACTL